MKKRNELQEKLKSAFEKPETSFNEWSVKNDVLIEIGSNVKSDVVITKLANNINGQNVNSRNIKQILLLVLPFLITIFLIITIIILNSFSHNSKPKIYGETDAVNIKIDLEEIVDNEDIYIFDLTNVVQVQAVSKDVLKSDESVILLYTLSDVLISVDNGTGIDAFNLTFKIRKYENYEFLGKVNYSELNHNLILDNININYDVIEINTFVGYASFKYNEYDYYIEARGFDGITDLNQDNFLNLLNKILV